MIHQIEQNTDEWLELRRGKITASNFGTVMANYGKAFGNPALQYAMRIAIESKTNRSIETYKNEWMERGIEMEQDARDLYSDMTFTDVLPGGFAEAAPFGASADGLSGDGLIEIKSVKYNTHFERLINGGFDTSYQWQIRGQMWLYDKPWCDFVSYCPDFPVNKQLYIFRVDRNAEEEEKLKSRLNEFKELVQSYIKILEQ